METKLDTQFKILCITYGARIHASSRIRAVEYFDIFREKLNAKISWIPRIPDLHRNKPTSKIKFALYKRFLGIKRLICITFCNYDLIFVQRAFISQFLLSILKWRKTPLIYDFDDAIYLKAFGKGNPESQTLRMLNAASAIVVSSPVLVSYCTQSGFNNIHLINTPIEPERFYKNQNQKVFTIGWIGSSYTAHYLTSIEASIRTICSKFPVKLMVIGAGKNFHIQGVEIENLDWNLKQEPLFISRMDVGLMPLNDDEFSKGKGGYKLFQYMAAGIPIIASPVGINTDIVISGENGFLAHTPDEWVKHLSYLINHPEECQRMGQNGRKQAETKYSRKHCSELMIEIIKSIC